jgi:hypothetical protein
MSKEHVPFYKIPDAPASVTAGTILSRLVDAIGFRFRWAVEGMADSDLAYKPAPDCMTHAELILHIHDLLMSTARNAGLPPVEPLTETSSCGQMISGVLELSSSLSARFKKMSDTDLAACTPALWNMINGPLADCLTHIGQILSWRRLAGAPPVPADLFRGLPPKEG